MSPFLSVLGLGAALGGWNRIRSLISWPIRIRYIRHWRLPFVRNLFQAEFPIFSIQVNSQVGFAWSMCLVGMVRLTSDAC